MSATLTSWKEIAKYIGKGVRTVQRWERMLRFPVRRPIANQKGIVLADTEEIDAWMASSTVRTGSDSSFELTRLRTMVAEMLAENALLRSELERLSGSTDTAPPGARQLRNGDRSQRKIERPITTRTSATRTATQSTARKSRGKTDR